MKQFAILILLSLPGIFSKAQGPGSGGESLSILFDNYITSANKAYKLNGSVLVAQKGKILLHRGYGFANVATQLSNDTLTRFPILSLTKSFTATAILKLQEEGKLSVKDKLSKYFPDYQYGDKVTIEQLLTHTSGINNYTDVVGEEDSSIINRPVSKERILGVFYKKPLEFSPGSQFSYSNSGYFLLGLIIEKVTGKPYEQFVRERILSPLGMTNSGFDFINLGQTTRAQGYNIFDGTQQRPYKHYDSTYAYSAGAMYSTTGDLFKFAGAIASNKILSAETWKIAFKPRINGYGYGWKTGNLFGRNYIRHDGGYPGFMSDFIYYPKEGITIIILNNFGNYGQSVWASAMGISCILFHLPYDNWQLRKEQKVKETVLKQYAGLYKLNKKTGLAITYDNGQLILKGTGKSGAPELPLLAEAENKFFLRDFNTTLTFIKDGDHFRLLVHEHGQDSEWKKER